VTRNVVASTVWHTRFSQRWLPDTASDLVCSDRGTPLPLPACGAVAVVRELEVCNGNQQDSYHPHAVDLQLRTLLLLGSLLSFPLLAGRRAAAAHRTSSLVAREHLPARRRRCSRSTSAFGCIGHRWHRRQLGAHTCTCRRRCGCGRIHVRVVHEVGRRRRRRGGTTTGRLHLHILCFRQLHVSDDVRCALRFVGIWRSSQLWPAVLHCVHSSATQPPSRAGTSTGMATSSPAKVHLKCWVQAPSRCCGVHNGKLQQHPNQLQGSIHLGLLT